ncbi:hypothetical protein [Piscinibacter terrae]|uniref:Uncharacterized protein n=1 Tax=Piscinibacter terrae TaxID=2496871 RepID=A0A3N7HNS0_9BURK|nr:hypothetical protein [Albitalea terrae]RQP23794.1 hypothetical protein DZC73_16880 [Albitalea terrae]
MTKPHTHSFEHAAAIHGYGMPDDRLARMAARRAFVEMKQVFMRAAADVDGTVGEMLQQRVRAANEPVELWRIRAVLLASLPAHHQRTLTHRIELHRQLDSLFPFNACATVPAPLQHS